MIRIPLRFRIALAIFVVEAVVLSLVLWYTVDRSFDSSRQQLAVTENVVLGLLEQQGRFALLTAEYANLQPHIERADDDPHITRIVLADDSGQVVAGSRPSDVGKPLPTLHNTGAGRWKKREIANVAGKLGTLAVEFSREPLQAAYRSARNLGILIGTAGLAATFVVCLLIGSLLTRRLDRLTRGVQRIAAGHFDFTTGVRGRDEIGDLGQAFDHMASTVATTLEELRDKDARLVSIHEAMNEGVWEWNLETGYVQYSPRWIESLGYSPDEVAPDTSFWQDIVHPDDLPRIQSIVQEYLTGQRSEHEAESRIRLGSGVWRWNRDRGKVLARSPDGKPLLLVGSDEDISERKAAEAALLESQVRRTGELLSLAQSLRSDQTLEERLADLCRRAVDLVGCDRSSIFLRKGDYYVAKYNCGNPPDIAALFARFKVRLDDPLIVDAMRQKGRIVINDIGSAKLMDQTTAKTARIQAMVVVPLIGRTDEPLGFMTAEYNETPGSFTDLESSVVLGLARVAAGSIIADELERSRRRAETALAVSEERFRMMIEHSIDAISLAEADGTYLYASPAGCDILGLAPGTLEGRNQGELLHPDDRERILALFIGFLEKPNAIVHTLARYAHTDGSWRYIEATTRNLLDNPSVRAVVSNARDVTERVAAEAERQRLQEALGRQEAMSTMGSLVANVAHEVRNPLFGISATLDAFEARFRVERETEQYLVVLRREVTRLSDLMRDLLDYGRPRSLDLVPCSLDDIVAATIDASKVLAADADVRITTNGHKRAAPAPMDRAHIEQAIQNLLQNSIQHSPRGGTVVVSVDRVGGAGGAWIQCEIRDSGSGFSAEDLPRIFEPFFSRRTGGTGLGLSLVQQIIEQHRGTILAANHPEGGAVVSFRLPLA